MSLPNPDVSSASRKNRDFLPVLTKITGGGANDKFVFLLSKGQSLNSCFSLTHPSAYSKFCASGLIFFI